MEAVEVLKEAWAVMRRARSLWLLGLIPAAATLALGFVGIVILAVAALPLVVISLEQNDEMLAGMTDTAVAALYEFLDTAMVTVGNDLTVFYVLLAMGVTAWFVLALLDVAAIGGLVTQVNAAAQGRQATLRAALSDGMRFWWRTAALWALSALPATIYALVISIAMWFAITLPINRGELPSPQSMYTGPGAMLQPLGTVTSLVSVPLGVLVLLSIRFGLIDDVPWREALVRAWSLARADLKRVAFVFGAVWAVTFAAGAVQGLLGGIVGILAAAVAFVGVASGWSGGMIAIVGALVALLLATTAVVQAFVGVYGSAIWTVFWRRATRPA